MTKTGTYNRVEQVFNDWGIKRKRKVMPEGIVLILTEMLNRAYMFGYSDGLKESEIE